MKTPTNIGGNNLASWLLTATEIRMADLYTITLKSGAVLRFTTWDSSIVFGNLLRFSEQFDNAVWTADEGPLNATVAANVATDPFGNVTADSINFTATGTGSLIAQYVTSPAVAIAGQQFTFSCWLTAAAGSPSLNLLIEDQTGAVIANQSFALNQNWQRFSVTGQMGSGSTEIHCFIYNPSATGVYYLWGAQLTQSAGIIPYASVGASPVGGNVFLTGPPNLERTAIEEKTGLDVATIEVVIRASLTDAINGTPLLQALGQGLWDGAAFRIDRLFMDSLGNQIGALNRFSGLVGPVDELTHSYAKLTVNSGMQYLTMQLPPVIMQPNCVHTLFDAGCTLNKASFTESNAVQGGSTVNKVISLSAKGDGYYDNGQILFTSGPNNGLLKAVKQYSAKDFYFNSPLPFAPNAGDTFTAYPGDDKTQATCTSKFNNLANFGGFPYVPTPETAI